MLTRSTRFSLERPSHSKQQSCAPEDRQQADDRRDGHHLGTDALDRAFHDGGIEIPAVSRRSSSKPASTTQSRSALERNSRSSAYYASTTPLRTLIGGSRRRGTNTRIILVCRKRLAQIPCLAKGPPERPILGPGGPASSAVTAARAPVAEIERVLGRYRDVYPGFTVKHFHEQLAKRHGYLLGYTVTKLHLHHARMVMTPAKTRSADRKKRPRRPTVGMLPSGATSS